VKELLPTRREFQYFSIPFMNQKQGLLLTHSWSTQIFLSILLSKYVAQTLLSATPVWFYLWFNYLF